MTWISVKERLEPLEYGRFLVRRFGVGLDRIDIAWWEFGYWRKEKGGSPINKQITHWQPLPEPPEE